MTDAVITYADVVTKQLVENWAEDRGFSAADQICLHVEERFGARSVRVVTAHDQGDHLVLRLLTDCWEKPKEFALLSDGALSW